MLRTGLHGLPLLALLLPAALGAQPGAEPRADLNQIALAWSRGDWRAPLVCTMEGTPHRGLRRVLVGPGPRNAARPSNRLQLFDLEVPGGTHCTDANGRPQPNARGSVYFHWEGRSRPDTAQHDFVGLLRRESGVDFRIRRGRLRLGEDTGEAGFREIDFGGGTARFSLVKRGSDAYRRLAGFGDRRKLALLLESPDGERLELDLVQLGPR